ncbi:MAG: hypothetical protein FJX34_03125 [Alphaproteobacteria bacterium]|nr:hypothetical protein [Alphaproteobacteria bacterium]
MLKNPATGIGGVEFKNRRSVFEKGGVGGKSNFVIPGKKKSQDIVPTIVAKAKESEEELAVQKLNQALEEGRAREERSRAEMENAEREQRGREKEISRQKTVKKQLAEEAAAQLAIRKEIKEMEKENRLAEQVRREELAKKEAERIRKMQEDLRKTAALVQNKISEFEDQAKNARAISDLDLNSLHKQLTKTPSTTVRSTSTTHLPHSLTIFNYLQKLDKTAACQARGQTKEGHKTYDVTCSDRSFNGLQKSLGELCERSDGMLRCETTSKRGGGMSNIKLEVSKKLTSEKLNELLTGVRRSQSAR